MVEEIDLDFFRWSSTAAAQWSFTGTDSRITAPIYQIHGEKDWVIGLQEGNESEVIENGRHLINLTHPELVNRFILQKIENHRMTHPLIMKKTSVMGG